MIFVSSSTILTVVVIWIFFGILGAAIGQKKGMNVGVAFLAGVVLGPFSLFMLFVTAENKKCPKCAEMVNKDAKLCKHCKHEF